MTLIILEGNCNGEGRQFEAFVQKRHPEIEIDYRERTSGVGGGLFDEFGDPMDGPDLWSEYCNSVSARTLGSIKSERKAAASRENGRKGGRPKGSKNKKAPPD